MKRILMTQSSVPDTPNTASTPKTYPCPRCGTKTPWQDNPNKPFCSPRCKLIDLGAWANEDYKFGAEDSPFSSDIQEAADDDY